MKVTRIMQAETNDICIGDVIQVNLQNFGSFTATAQEVTDKGILFQFDEVIACHCMNEIPTNKGGYDASDMQEWLQGTVLQAFPEELRSKVIELTLPTYGQIFGHDYYYDVYEPDNDVRFESMERRGNRVCDFEDEWCYWWLRNTSDSSSSFAVVTNNGYQSFAIALECLGVRPVFWIKLKSRDIKSELEYRFQTASEEQMDELDFYSDLIDTGITPEMVRNTLGNELADHMQEFCKEHGLI